MTVSAEEVAWVEARQERKTKGITTTVDFWDSCTTLCGWIKGTSAEFIYWNTYKYQLRLLDPIVYKFQLGQLEGSEAS